MNIEEVIQSNENKETSCIQDEQHIDNKNKVRKRGRPRKNNSDLIKTTTTKKNTDVEDDIIIHFPISSHDVNKEQMNGFELIQTECNEDFDENDDIENNISDKDNDEKNCKRLMEIIKEKDKIISELENKLVLTTEANENIPSISQSVKIYSIDTPYNKTANGNLIIPEHTNNACLWDTHEINGGPCFLPDKYYNGTFHVIGSFCSLNCAVAYNLSLDDSKVSERLSLLKWLYGKTQDKILPSPTIRILKKFGGVVTIDDYRSNLFKGEKDYRLIIAPITCTSQYVEERKRVTDKKKSENRPNIIEAMKYKKKNV
jgi:hypothetical protein